MEGSPASNAMGPATLLDVARLAGVSPKTVARALNGEPHVRPATRDQVLQAAKKLRFRPNLMARELRQGGRTRAVALVIGSLDNPFYARIGAGLEKVLREANLELLIASTDDDPDREAAVIHGMLERRVQALLVVPAAQSHAYLEGERQSGMPIVFIDRPSSTLAADCVMRDNRSAARDAVRQFINYGHRRIAVIGDHPELYTARERLDGVRDGILEANIEIDDSLIRTGVHDTASAHSAVAALLGLPDPPTAYLALNNRISIGALEVLLKATSRPAFIGFDDFDLATVLDISVITNDPQEMGERAARLALARITGDDSPPHQVVLPTRLIQRGTGERRPFA